MKAERDGGVIRRGGCEYLPAGPLNESPESYCCDIQDMQRNRRPSRHTDKSWYREKIHMSSTRRVRQN